MATHRIGKQGEPLRNLENSNTGGGFDIVDKEDTNSSIPAVLPSNILNDGKDKNMGAPSPITS